MSRGRSFLSFFAKATSTPFISLIYVENSGRDSSEAGFSPKIISQTETVSSPLMQVACGVGISVLYKEHQPILGNLVVFVPLSGNRLFNRYLIWNQYDNPCQDAFVAVAKELYNVH